MKKLWFVAAALMSRSRSSRLRLFGAAIPVVALASKMLRDRRAAKTAAPLPGKASDLLVSNARRTPELRAEDVASAPLR